MKRKSTLLFVAACSLIILSSFMIFNPGGAPSPYYYTGSPGDGHNCSQCHGSAATTATGWITSTIPSGGYIAGQTYQVTATNNISGSGKYGFEVSPQNVSGTLLGTLAAGSGNKLVGSGKYVTHSSSSSSTKTWTFSWTAPAAGTGNVTFYGAFARNYSGPTTLSTLVVSEQSGTLPGAAGPITGPANICKNNIYNYAVGSITGATSYVWSVPTGSTITSGQGTTSISVNFSASAVSGNVSVYGANGTGNGTPGNLPVTVNSVPSQPIAITGPDVTDLASVVTSDYITPGATDATSYLWELTPANAGAISGTGLTGTVTWDGSYLGVAQIRVKALNTCGEGAWSEIKSTEVINTTGITNVSSLPCMKVYPSPGNGSFTVALSGISGQVKLRILDITGHELYNTSLPGNEETHLEYPLSPGIYLLIADEGAGIIKQKLIIR
jgi:hypothetical protein